LIMGYGDDIMALGEAEAIHRITGARVLIVDKENQPRWSPVWENHPAIAASVQEPHRVRLTNGVGARPYVRAWASAEGMPMCVYSNWHARDHLGHLVLSPTETDFGRELRAKVGPYVVVQPNVKPRSSPNKDWGLERYQDVIGRMPGTTFVQLSPDSEDARMLKGVTVVRTPTFRKACGVLAQAQAYLGPEGGLHHAAAALRVPGVVIFGSFIHPRTTGYDIHCNLYVQDQHGPCGRWAPCQPCVQALDRIQPEDVARCLAGVISQRCHHGIPHE
jgi:hypothetical protein